MNFLRPFGSQFTVVEHSNFSTNWNSKADTCFQWAICFHLSEHAENKHKYHKRCILLACKHRQILLGYSKLFWFTVLCKSNESEMCEFRSVSANFLWKFARKFKRLFCNVLSIISLKQRTKLCGTFKTKMKIPYQRDNSACSMRNIAVQCADQYRAINVLFFCEQSWSHWGFTPL